MIPTIRDIDAFLGGQIPPHQLRQVPGLAWMADAIDSLHRYRAERWRFAADRAREQRARLEERRDGLEGAQKQALRQIRSDFEALGVTVTGATLEAVQHFWPEVSDLVHRHVRDVQLLGSVDGLKEQRDRLVEQGMVPTDPLPDPLIERARRLRQSLAEATDRAAQVMRLDEQIEGVDVYEVDEQHTAIHRELRAQGYIPVPNAPGALPEMDADLAAGLQRLGFTTQASLSR